MAASTATGVGLAAAAQNRVLVDAQWKDYEDVIEVGILNGVNKAALNSGQAMTSADYNNLAIQIRQQLDAAAPSAPIFQSSDEAARLRWGINSLASVAASAPAGSLLPHALFSLGRTKFIQLETALAPSRQTPADLALYSVKLGALQFIADQVQQASDLAENDPQFAAAVNPILHDLTAFDVTNSYAEIQASYGTALPTLPSPNGDGSYTVNSQDLVSQYQSLISNAQAAVDTVLTNLESKAPGAAARLRPLDTTSNVNCTNGKPPQDASAGVCWSDLQSGITGISKLVGLQDSTLSTQISSVGTAAINAGQAIAQLAGGALSGFATAGPVGAIIGAGVSIFSTFFSSSSNPNAAVLAQIQKLSQQITRLQQDMDAQFAAVDATLNTILNTLTQNFALINYQLGVLNGDAKQIQNSLLDVEAQLNQAEQYTLAYQQAQQADTLSLSLNGCLNHRSTHNGQDIGSNLFNTCQNTFFTWAQTNASDAIWAPQPSNYTDAGVFNFFQDFSNSGVCPNGCPTPFAVDVNYLNKFPAQNLGLSALSPLTQPNPDEWTLGGRSYLQMAYEWPQYASGLNSSYLNQLIQIGTNLQQAAQNINSTRPANQSIAANAALFNALSAKCTTTVTALQNAAEADVVAYQNNPANGLTKNGSTLNLWIGGANQTTNWRPSIPTIQRCDNSGSTLSAPSNLLSFVPGIYAFAEGYLNSGQIDVCIAGATWTAPTRTLYVPSNPNDCSVVLDSDGGASCNAGCAGPVDIVDDQNNGHLYCYPSHKYTYADISLTISLKYQNLPVVSVPQTSNQDTIEFDDTYANYVTYGDGSTGWVYAPTTTATDIIAGVEQNWTSGLNLKNALNSSVQNTQIPQPQLLSSIAAQLDSVIAGHQHNIYGMIASDFNAAGSGVQAAGQLLSGDKLLDQAYASFGLPMSLATDPTLRGALYGNQAVYDGPAVQQDFATFSTAPITDTTDNKITDEVGAINARLSVLNGAIGTALNNVQNNQLPESLSQIDVTLQDLQTLANLQAANALTPCSFQLSSSTGQFGAFGASGTINVQELNGCAWKATTNAPWLTVTSGTSGSGNGAVSFAVAANATASPRDAIFVIGDQVLHVTQGGQGGSTSGCTYALDHSAQDFSSTGGTANLFVLAPLGCSWTATPSSSWISIGNTASVTGNGSVSYNVSANPSSQPRNGNITVQGQTLAITQLGSQSGCSYSLDHSNKSFAALGGTDVITVSPGSGCSWTAATSASWLTISGSSSGSGNGTLSYSVTANPTGQPRSGTIVVSSQTFTVVQAGIGLRFVPITPCRVADTRNTIGAFGGPMMSGQTSRDFAIPASSCGIPSTAQAYSLNVTVVPSTWLGYLSLWPSGQPQPTVSTLNSDGRVKANAVLIPAGNGGAVSVYASNDTHVILDINGYFVPASDSSALAFFPLTPCRIADTRNATGMLGGPSLTAGQSRDFPILLSNCGLPSNAQAYSLNFTAVPHGGLSYLATWPAGQTKPLVSTLNSNGAVTANAAIVPAGTNGAFSVYVTDAIDLVIDVNGYFAPMATGGLSLYNLVPCRALDTRIPTGAQPFIGQIDSNLVTSSCTVPSVAQALYLTPLWYLPAASAFSVFGHKAKLGLSFPRSTRMARLLPIWPSFLLPTVPSVLLLPTKLTLSSISQTSSLLREGRHLTIYGIRGPHSL